MDPKPRENQQGLSDICMVQLQLLHLLPLQASQPQAEVVSDSGEDDVGCDRANLTASFE